MTRTGFVAIAGVVIATAFLTYGPLNAQTTPAPKTKAGADQPAPKSKSTPPSDKPQASAPAGSLGSVQIPKKVTADGKPLEAGTYTLRLSNDAVTPVTGQADDSKWVEFVQGGQVKGRELATVLSAADAKQIAKRGMPAAGTAKVETLKGDNYVRVWVNHAGTNYLIHLGSS
jgi:hypothetical protein